MKNLRRAPDCRLWRAANRSARSVRTAKGHGLALLRLDRVEDALAAAMPLEFGRHRHPRGKTGLGKV